MHSFSPVDKVPHVDRRGVQWIGEAVKNLGYPDLSVFGRSVYNVVLEVQNRTSLLLARARSTMMKPDFDVGITSTLS
ncbi:MAG: hypothetical protein EKK52_06360 [Burkholderiales bacterium]|uniref:hypothetical protein n=1 Tax=Roseateles sp. TaxID=1971397 RepID=UPI000FAB6171|nr:MAG: hypothetical protein EKK52_06360 [Burkholderiales bacterium]